MLGRRILVAMLALAALIGVPAVAQAQSTITFSGAVAYNGSYAPVANDVMLVRVCDDKGNTYGTATVTLGGKTVPYAYSVSASGLTSGANYLVVAEIGTAAKARKYMGSYSIRASGAAVTVPNFTIGARGGTLGDTSAGVLTLVAGIALAAMAGALWLWRQRRVAMPVLRTSPKL